MKGIDIDLNYETSFAWSGFGTGHKRVIFQVDGNYIHTIRINVKYLCNSVVTVFFIVDARVDDMNQW